MATSIDPECKLFMAASGVKIDLDFDDEKATPCDHIVRFDAGYAFLGDADDEDGRAELMTEAGESVSYDIEFTYCPKCGVKLENR